MAVLEGKNEPRPNSSLLVIALSIVLLSGCASPSQDFKEAYKDLSEAWHTNGTANAIPPIQLDWKSAAQRLVDENLSMRMAREGRFD
jgi:PBP1b-binding outer membrane lipoprotein LpoB